MNLLNMDSEQFEFEPELDLFTDGNAGTCSECGSVLELDEHTGRCSKCSSEFELDTFEMRKDEGAGLIEEYDEFDDQLFEEELEYLDMKLVEQLLDEESNRKSHGYVRWVQSSLNKVLGLRLTVDGLMGRKTRTAIRSFQRKHGLRVDGKVGAKTERALISAGAPAPAERPGRNVSEPLPASPLPASLIPDFSRAVGRLRLLVMKHAVQLRFRRVNRLLCFLTKVASPEVDDRVIFWRKLCGGLERQPFISDPGCAEARERQLTRAFLDDRTNVSIPLANIDKAVERANRQLRDGYFISHLRPIVLNAGRLDDERALMILRYTDGQITQSHRVLFTLSTLKQFPRAWRPIMHWLWKRAGDPKSVLYCVGR